MYKFMSIAYITIIMGFMVVYITAFVLNLMKRKEYLLELNILHLVIIQNLLTTLI